MSSTLNVNGNRQVVVACSSSEQIFKIPDGLDLEDKTVVKNWIVKWGILYIGYVNGGEQEIDAEWEDDYGCKYPDAEIEDADDCNIECNLYSKYLYYLFLYFFCPRIKMSRFFKKLIGTFRKNTHL